MNAEAILLVGGIVVALTQFAKWAGVPDRLGPIAVIVLSILGVAVYALSFDDDFTRSDLWPYFAAWASVTFNAAGIYGFTRAAPESITATRNPPAGAAQTPTGKM